MLGREEAAHFAPGANAVVVADARAPAVPALALLPTMLAAPLLRHVPPPHAVLVRAVLALVAPRARPHAVHFPVHAVLLERGGLGHPLDPPPPLHLLSSSSSQPLVLADVVLGLTSGAYPRSGSSSYLQSRASIADRQDYHGTNLGDHDGAGGNAFLKP